MGGHGGLWSLILGPVMGRRLVGGSGREGASDALQVVLATSVDASTREEWALADGKGVRNPEMRQQTS